MANTIKLGSLYLDDHPVEIGAEYVPSQSIKVGGTITGKEIIWVVVNGILIADRCILTNVTWDDLNFNSLVFGKHITIGGYHYKTRLLKVGPEVDVPNEWDAALDAVGEDNELWHWGSEFFWGQETPTSLQASSRAYRGYHSVRYWGWFDWLFRYSGLGFRPALVPLASEIHSHSPVVLGQQLMIWSGQNIAWGCLEDVTDYDIVLSDWRGTVLDNPSCGWTIVDGKLVATLEAIAGMQTQEGA